MNNKTPLIAGIIVLILLVAGGVYFAKSGKNTPAANSTNEQQSTTQSSPSPSASATPTNVLGVETDNNTNTTDAAAPQTQTFSVEGGSYYFRPNEIKVKKGEKVKITLTGNGGMPHNFNIDAFNVQSNNVTNGESTTVEFTADKTGTFEFYCGVGNHRQQGQVGKLIVE